MTFDDAQVRSFIEQYVTINHATDRIEYGWSGSCTNSTVAAQPDESVVERAARRIRAFDSRNCELEQELRRKDADYTGIVMEYQDVADENRRLKQELEIKTIVAAAKDETIRRLRAELADLKSRDCCGK